MTFTFLSSFQDDAEGSSKHIEVDINTPDDACNVNVGASTSSQAATTEGIIVNVPSNICAESIGEDDIVEEIVESAIGEIIDPEDSNEEILGIFCDKKRKKVHGREQVLQTCVTQENINLFKCQASEMNDMDMLNKIEEKCANNSIIFYHRHCKIKLQKYFTVDYY